MVLAPQISFQSWAGLLLGTLLFLVPRVRRRYFCFNLCWSDGPLSYRLAQFCPDKPPRMMLEKQQSQRCSSVLPSQGESKMVMVIMVAL